MTRRRSNTSGRDGDRGRPAESRGNRDTWLLGLAVLILSLLLRILYWKATPDSTWPYSAVYRGDAITWLEYAYSLQKRIPYQLGLPLRPPGMGYLVATLWDGTRAGIANLKVLWCVGGALAVVFFYAALVRPFGARVACLAGIGAAASTALLMLSTSLNNEIPYLVLVMASFALFGGLWDRPNLPLLALWSALNAWACLVRVEHLMVYLPILFYLSWRWLWARGPETERGSAPVGARLHVGRAVPAVALSIACFLLLLLPWQMQVRSAVTLYNIQPRPSDEGMTKEALQTEQLIREMEWEPAALREKAKLPGFVRRLACDFVAATVRSRGREEVRAEDFTILKEAFGYVPEPLSSVPFVSAYGPLNFYLANNAHATGGFNRLALDDPPPLVGGPGRYYPDLLLSPPGPGMFFLDYPPHLHAFRHGYALGGEWLRSHPEAALRLLLRKLQTFWSGASLGFTGYGLPLGASGLQRAVDLLVPEGGLPVAAWRMLVLGLCLAGVWMARDRSHLIPWSLYLLGKVAVSALFFGYARVGATAAPVVLLLCALALDGAWIRLRTRKEIARSIKRGQGRLSPRIAAVAVCLLLLLVEGIRCASHPRITIDGVRVVSADPVSPELQTDRNILIR